MDTTSNKELKDKYLTIQVLVSTMNQKLPRGLSEILRINKHVIINQITNDVFIPKEIKQDGNIVVSVREKGLSRSRNLAIRRSSADICVISDDDMFYVDNYEGIVRDGYLKYPDADIIAFYVDSEDPRQNKSKLKEGRVGLLNTMKLASWNITFNRKSIKNSGILFDQQFGTGTENYMGEENIFLFDCYKKGLVIYYIPNKIATIKESESTWFKGYDNKYFTVKGRVYYRMSPLLSLVLIFQFAIRKINLYRRNINVIRAIMYMLHGAYFTNKTERS